jgi:Na+-driven multidrug efflux pump
LVALAGLVFPRLILAIFIHDPLTLELAVFPMRLIAATMAFDTVGTVLMNALLGAGDSRRVMVFSVLLQWGLFLPVAYLLGPTLGFGMTGVWMAQVFYRLLQTICFIALWRQGKWALIRV